MAEEACGCLCISECDLDVKSCSCSQCTSLMLPSEPNRPSPLPFQDNNVPEKLTQKRNEHCFLEALRMHERSLQQHSAALCIGHQQEAVPNCNSQRARIFDYFTYYYIVPMPNIRHWFCIVYHCNLSNNVHHDVM